MVSKLFQKKCIPCEGNEKPLEAGQIADYLGQVEDWEVAKNKKIQKSFEFGNFKKAVNFINQVAEIAEQEQHHPDIYIFYNRVKLELYTHAIGGLSENDFIMAAKIDRLN